MTTRFLLRSLVSTANQTLIPRFYTTTTSSSILRIRPFISVATNLRHAALVSTGIRTFSTRQTTSSLNDSNPNWSNRPPKETILLDGCDFEHWLVVVEKPEGEPTRDEIIDLYINTLAKIVGSYDEARMKIYSVSTRCYYAFGALVSEEDSYKLKELPGVRWVLPDSYLDVKNKDYGGEPFIDGKAVPYDPKYHEEWIRNNARANERNRRNDRPRNFDRSRNFERRRENMQTNRSPPGGGPMGGPPPNNMGGPPPNAGSLPPPSGNMGGMQQGGGMGGPPNAGGAPPPGHMGGGMGGPPNAGGGQPNWGGPRSSYNGGSPNMGGGMPPPNMHGGVPPNMGGGMPPSNMGGGMPPNNMGGGMPPNNMGGGMPPNNMGGGMPPNNMGGGMPPNNMGGGMPPNNMGGGMPPNNMGGGVPPNNMGGRMPPPNYQQQPPRYGSNNGGGAYQSGPGSNNFGPNAGGGNGYQNQDLPGRDMPPPPNYSQNY